MALVDKISSVLWISMCRGIGDAVLLYPAVKKSLEVFPGARIDIALQSPAAREIFRIYGFDGNIIKAPQNLAALGLWVARGAGKRYDLVIDASSVEHVRLSRIMSRFCGQISVGYDYGSLSRLYTKRLDTGIMAAAHMKDIYAGLLRPYGYDGNIMLEDIPENRQIKSGINVTCNEIRIVVHPGVRDNVSQFERRWPSDNYKELILRLIAAYPVKVSVIGSENEANWINTWTKDVPETAVEVLAGKTDIAGMIEYLRSSDLFIGNISGPMHIAAALDKPILTFAGGVPLSRWGAAGKVPAVMAGLDKKCQVCEEYECKWQGKKCLEAITVEEVFKEAGKLIENIINGRK